MIIRNEYVKKSLDFAGKYLHAPEQRLLLGATALATQPFIDMHNKNVDKETRMMSVARTIAKIIAGTLVGVAVRQAGISFVKAFCKYKPVTDSAGKIISVAKQTDKDFFVPILDKLSLDKGLTVEKLNKKFNLYTKALGTFFATVAMVFTNFLLDAPLTKWMTGVFHKKIVNKEAEASQERKAVEK